MEISPLRNRSSLEQYFRRNIALHAYSLGDLDDFFWPDTTYYGLETPAGVDLVSVLYRGKGLPVLLALTESSRMDQEYFDNLVPWLPDEFWAHLSPDLEKYLTKGYSREDFGDHIKMELVFSAFPEIAGLELVRQLSAPDLPEMEGIYRSSYPGNAFDPRLVRTGKYYGCWKEGSLVSLGGVHVYSERYSIAVLGNITTHPDHRNQGLGRLVTARICQDLMDSVAFIGLNVKADNRAAINLYRALGFRFSANYGEFSLKKGP